MSPLIRLVFSGTHELVAPARVEVLALCRETRTSLLLGRVVA